MTTIESEPKSSGKKAAKIRIPSPTEWLSVKDAPPPEETWLLVAGKTFSDLKDVEEEEFIEQGFLSERTGMFISREGECLNDMFEVTDYHVIYDPRGKMVRVVQAGFDIVFG